MNTPLIHFRGAPMSLVNSCTRPMVFRVVACPAQGPWLLADNHRDDPLSVFVESPPPHIHPGDLISGDWMLDQYASAQGTLWATSTLRHVALISSEVAHG